MEKCRYPLDNAGMIFPTIIGKVAMAIWRVSATLNEKVDPNILLQATNNLLPRFSYFAVSLKKGFFWNYFETNSKPAIIHKDTKNPCIGMNFKRDNNGYLFAVKYFENRIAIEGFHALADGYGGMVLLKNLVAEYLRLCGHQIDVDEKYQIFDLSKPACIEEYEDAYKRYYQKEPKTSTKHSSKQKIKKTKVAKVFHLCPKQRRHQLHNMIIGTLPTSQIVALAKSFGCTIGEFLATVYAQSLCKIRDKSNQNRDVVLCIPINLRSQFPSKTLHNFSGVCNIRLPKKDYTFEQLLQEIRSQLSKLTQTELLQKDFSSHVALEKNAILNYLPLFVKAPLMAMVYLAIGESGVTAAMSNMGKISLPQTMEGHIQNFCVNTVAGYLNPKACGVVGFGDNLCITFTSTVDDNEAEREFFTYFSNLGISVKIDSNIH